MVADWFAGYRGHYGYGNGDPAGTRRQPRNRCPCAFFSQVQTFEARFRQLVLDESLNAIDDGRGTVWIKRPGRFRWDYDLPDPQEIVGDGERIWLHDIDLEQVTVRDQAQALGRTPAILLAGSGDLDETYRIEDIGVQGRYDWVNLIPEDPESALPKCASALKTAA